VFSPSPASEGARSTAQRRGLDLSAHRSRALTVELLDRADLVLAMTHGHLLTVVELGGGGSAALLPSFAAGEGDAELVSAVPDPFGGSDEVYEETFKLLEVLVDRTLNRLEPVLKP